jgi:Fe-S-cluster containining protein
LRPVEAFATMTRGREPYVYEMRKTRGEGKCIFLEGADCEIYAVRPLVCRFYPFELATLKNRELSFFCTEECPGIGRGERLEREYFENLFRWACEKLGR